MLPTVALGWITIADCLCNLHFYFSHIVLHSLLTAYVMCIFILATSLYIAVILFTLDYKPCMPALKYIFLHAIVSKLPSQTKTSVQSWFAFYVTVA